MTRIIISLLIAVACIYLSAFMGTLSGWWVFPTACIAFVVAGVSVGAAFSILMHGEKK